MNLWWISKIHLIQQLYFLHTNTGNTVESNYLNFFLLLSLFLSQTQAPEEAVSEGLQISLEGFVNYKLQGAQQGKPSSPLVVVLVLYYCFRSNKHKFKQCRAFLLIILSLLAAQNNVRYFFKRTYSYSEKLETQRKCIKQVWIIWKCYHLDT